jgi:hypothetical protein
MWKVSIHETSFRGYSIHSRTINVGAQATSTCVNALYSIWRNEKGFDAFGVLRAKLLHILQQLFGGFKYMNLCFYLFCFVRVLFVCYFER